MEFAERADSVRREKRPIREIAGMPVELIRAFSQRRAVIEDRLADLSFAPIDASMGGSRPRRRGWRWLNKPRWTPEKADDPRADSESISTSGDLEPLPCWGVRAPDDLVINLTGAPVRTLTVEQVDTAALATPVVATLQESRSTWTRWHVIAGTERVTRRPWFSTFADRDRVVALVRDRVWPGSVDPD